MYRLYQRYKGEVGTPLQVARVLTVPRLPINAHGKVDRSQLQSNGNNAGKMLTLIYYAVFMFCFVHFVCNISYIFRCVKMIIPITIFLFYWFVHYKLDMTKYVWKLNRNYVFFVRITNWIYCAGSLKRNTNDCCIDIFTQLWAEILGIPSDPNDIASRG